LGITKKTAREGARHKIAPGSARGNQIAGRLRGREGGRYNRREAIELPISTEVSPPCIAAFVVAAFAATNMGTSERSPGRARGYVLSRAFARDRTSSLSSHIAPCPKAE